MQVKSNIKNYDVKIETNSSFIDKLIRIENAEFVIDKRVYEIYNHLFTNIPYERLLIIEATEHNKVIDTALNICERITEISAKKNAFLISFGGGIIQDITGFVANITYRGINWIYVPTTLLAACDSCIGAKTSLNYKNYKNLLGTFYPPNNIHIYSDFFLSLSERDFKSGLGEVIKFNIMSGQKGLLNIEENIESLLTRDVKTMNRFIESSLFFKKVYIELDEFDKDKRILLNFAHTFGHSIEVVSNYEIPHGTAVAIGMIIANRISNQRGMLTPEIIRRIEKVLLRVIDIDITLMICPIEKYIKVIKKDKKQINQHITTVLITQYNDMCELDLIHNTTEDEICDAINYFIYLYKMGK